MAREKKPQTIEESPMEIKTRIEQRPRAIPPWGDQGCRRGLRPRTPGKGLTPFANPCSKYPKALEGDILTLLKRGHFNFAGKGDTLTLP